MNTTTTNTTIKNINKSLLITILKEISRFEVSSLYELIFDSSKSEESRTSMFKAIENYNSGCYYKGTFFHYRGCYGFHCNGVDQDNFEIRKMLLSALLLKLNLKVYDPDKSEYVKDYKEEKEKIIMLYNKILDLEIEHNKKLRELV